MNPQNVDKYVENVDISPFFAFLTLGYEQCVIFKEDN